jgi:ABC-type transport system involved in multi-copper enzyme maturation permease subunit
MTATSGSSNTWNPSLRQEVGKAIFGAVVLLELLMVSIFGPSLTVGAITSERERQTFDLLRTTLLSARSLVLGKLGSAFTYLFLLILTALPIQSLAFLLGGVGIGEMVAASLMLIVTALFFCTLGIFFSSFMKRTLTASISSYGAMLGSFLLIVLVFLLIAYIQNSFSYDYNHPNPTRDYLLTMLLWLLISTNSFLAAIMSETILVDDQSLYITKQSIFGNNSYYLLSPWIIYIVFYLLLTLLLIFLSVRRVQRPDR